MVDEWTGEAFDSLYELDNAVKEMHAWEITDSKEGAMAKLVREAGYDFCDVPEQYTLTEQNDAHIAMWRYWDSAIDAKKEEEEKKFAEAYMDIAAKNLEDRANSI